MPTGNGARETAAQAARINLRNPGNQDKLDTITSRAVEETTKARGEIDKAKARPSRNP